jgi:hypothetical protein
MPMSFAKLHPLRLNNSSLIAGSPIPRSPAHVAIYVVMTAIQLAIILIGMLISIQSGSTVSTELSIPSARNCCLQRTNHKESKEDFGKLYSHPESLDDEIKQCVH